MDEILKIVFGCLVTIFFIFGYILRHRISYIFCPLPKYTGKIYKGKAHYYLTVHFILSIGLAITCLALLQDIEFINSVFDESLIRIFSFILLWFIWFAIIGHIIETFLVRTDKEYQVWKQASFKKDVDTLQS